MVIRPYVLNHNTFLRPVGAPPATLDEVLLDIGGNSGNSYITHAMSRFTNLDHLVGVANIFVEGAIDAVDVEDVNANYTHVFLVLQDHLRVSASGLPWLQLGKLISRLRIPVVVFSLGANAFGETAQQLAMSLPPTMVDFFRLLDDHAQSIGIRGHFTAEVLNHLGITNFAIVGCPAWFEAGPDRVVAYPPLDLGKPIAATGLFSHAECGKIHFMLQDEHLFLRSLFSGTPPTSQYAEALVGGYPHYGACAIDAFFGGRMHFFHDMNEWKDALSGRFSFAVGTRVHGAFISMNAGIPALCTSGDARSAEMCALFKVPHMPGICAAEVSLERLYQAADPSAANSAYPDLYRNFQEWLIRLGVSSGYRRSKTAPWPAGALTPRPAPERADCLVAAIGSARSSNSQVTQ